MTTSPELRALVTPRRALYDVVRGFALSPAAAALVFAWGFLEAVAWPIVPELIVVLLVLAAPKRVLTLAAAACAGSVAGGLVAYGLDAAGWGHALLAHVPLVTERMIAQAGEWLQAGAGGLLHQPLTGVPYKVFALQAHTTGVELVPFLALSILVRGARVLAIGLVLGSGAAVARRWMRKAFMPLVVLYGASFAVGLARVVAAWS